MNGIASVSFRQRFFALIYGLRNRVEMWRETRAVKKISDFLYSPLFIYILGVVTLGLNLLGIDELTYAVLTVAAVFALVCCHDIMPAFAVLIFSAVACSVDNRYNVKFNLASYIFVGIFIGIIAVCAVFHLLTNFSYKRLRDSRLIIGIILLSAGLITNGFFFSGYVMRNLPRGAMHIVYTAGFYLLLLTCARSTRDSLRYFAFICVVHGLVVGAQLSATYFINKPFIESGFSKDKLILGWGVSNTIGETLFRDMPFCFYLVCTEKKNNWYYFAVACLIVVAQVFSYARASLLFTLPLFVLCYVFCCIFGNNRKQIIICGIAAVVLGITGFAIIWKKVYSMLEFFVSSGLSDRGRFWLWDSGLGFFKENPVFGVGLMYKYRQLYPSFVYYHNTLVQYTVSGGIVGIVTLLLFRMQIYALFTQKFTRDKFFLTVLVCGILLISLLDNFVMYMATQLYLNFAIVFAEHDLNRSLPFAYSRRGKRYKRLF